MGSGRGVVEGSIHKHKPVCFFEVAEHEMSMWSTHAKSKYKTSNAGQNLDGILACLICALVGLCACKERKGNF